MSLSEDVSNEKDSSDDQLDKDLEALILTDQKSQSQNRAHVVIPDNDRKQSDTDVEDLLYGIEKGQLEISNVEKEIDSENSGQSGKSSENEAEDMDVLILQDTDTSPKTGISPAGNNWRNGEWAQSDTPSDNDDETDYVFTEDQKRASLELEHLRAENDYFPDEDPPEYDVKDRIKQLNADLALEPVLDEREHKVQFKENPVSLVVPPAEFWGATKDNGDNSSWGGDVTKISDDNTEENQNVRFRSTKDIYKPSSQPESEESEIKTEDTGQTNDSVTDQHKQKVLVEKDGKFELVYVDSVQALQMDMMNLEEKSDDKDSKEQSENVNSQPRPPSGPRPVSSSGYAQRSNTRQSRTRPHSANVHHSSTLNTFSYVSPYGLTQEEKRRLEDTQQTRENQEKKNLARRKTEENKKLKENEEAFQGWLQRKRNAARSTSNTDNKPVIKEMDQEKCFKDWLVLKKEQNKREKLLKKREEEEKICAQNVRTQQDCNQAFRQWLRKKSHAALCRQRIERQKYGLYSIGRRRPRQNRSFQFSDWNFNHEYHSF